MAEVSVGTFLAIFTHGVKDMLPVQFSLLCDLINKAGYEPLVGTMEHCHCAQYLIIALILPHSL